MRETISVLVCPGGGQGGGVRVQAGAVRGGYEPWERGSRVECRVRKRRKWSSTYAPKVRTQTRARTRGNTGSWTLHRRDEKERATACARPAQAAQTGSAALRRDSTQTSLSRHMSCTRKRRGAQPLPENSGPENSGFPSPQLMQRPLPVRLACICRSMRWLLSTHDADRILVRIPHRALCSCRVASLALTMALTRHAPSCHPPLVPCKLRRCT
jgi:hypothetical protein